MGSNIKILKDKAGVLLKGMRDFFEENSHAKWLVLFIALFAAFGVFFKSDQAHFKPGLKFSENSNFSSLFLEHSSGGSFVAVTPFNFIDGAAIKPLPISYFPASGTLGTIIESAIPGSGSKEITEYVIQQDDTLSSIAEAFGIDLATITQANSISSKAVLKPGDKLIILPVIGLLHYVKDGENISYLAQLYQVGQKDIIDFNELSELGQIFIGDLLIVPGGKPPKKTAVQVQLAPLADSFFISPLGSGYRVSQGLHWYNAVDLTTGQCGSAVFAAAGGAVQKTGTDRVAGKYVRILHSSGVITFYGHLSSILAFPGQQVSQGQIIGYTGYTGYTLPRGPAGCHLHFEVRGARNPFAY